MFLFKLLVVASSLLSLSAVVASASEMFIISDMHYDPYFATADAVGPCTSPSTPWYGAYRCDSSEHLIHSAIDAVFEGATKDGAGIFLYTGDMLRHEMDRFFVNTSSDYFVRYRKPLEIAIQTYNKWGAEFSKKLQALGTVVPHPNLIATMGNEEAIPDYLFQIESPIHPSLGNYSDIWRKYKLISEAEAEQYSRCGFYTRLLEVPAVSPIPLLIINLNTNLYSPRNDYNLNASMADPCGQFEWLDKQLSQAMRSGYRVHIMGHIIPQVGKWYDSYIAVYRNILINYNKVIAAQWFAHRHMFTFMAFSKDDSTPPLYDVPSITPRSGSLSSFVKVKFEKDWSVAHIHHHYLDPSSHTWVKGTTFGSDYGLADLSTSSLYHYAMQLLQAGHHDKVWEKFLALYQGGEITMPLSKKEKAKIVCRMFATTEEVYEECRGK